MANTLRHHTLNRTFKLQHQTAHRFKLRDQLTRAVYRLITAASGGHRQLIDILDVVRDLIIHLSLLFYRIGNLSAAVSHLVEHFVNLHQAMTGFRRLLIALLRQRRPALDRFHRLRRNRLQAGDHLLNFAGR